MPRTIEQKVKLSYKWSKLESILNYIKNINICVSNKKSFYFDKISHFSQNKNYLILIFK